ncbi:hypothetical protein F418_p49 [Hafnia phage Enc34]|uniref:Uncharacterized protein n=1 Tax=Hafnia phage Enc34 TaxID=1150990 RepID=H6WYL1_9CAUD|nr:hypothetical protein F418_p49 [Hafnia phage Enc34]AFB84066.1 hypothetical protein [Hafnia phage Enc34]
MGTGNHVFIRYTTPRGKTKIQEIESFCFDGMRTWYQVGSARAGTQGELKCLMCNSNNWTENGRTINEYECAGCGYFVKVEPKNNQEGGKCTNHCTRR